MTEMKKRKKHRDSNISFLEEVIGLGCKIASAIRSAGQR